jgi:tRNA dimethylallyltransferase
MKRPKVVAIVGPTCTGKTDLSLYIARRIPAEIICCDSRNVYKYFDIGSAKPTPVERSEVPHHLIDVAEPDEDFTAALYASLGKAALEEIAGRGRLPIVCGGTGFYARALLQGLAIPEVPPQKELRSQLQMQEKIEPGFLHRRLLELDPGTAQRLNPNDHFRLVRALEVCTVTGRAFSELARSREAPYQVLWIGLSIRDREKLKTLIKERLQEQMVQGMLAEVQELCRRFGRSQKLMNTVNYRDLCKYLAGELSMVDALAASCQHNYQLARRQMMWFKTNPEICWFYVDETFREKIELAVLHKIQAFMAEV